MKKMKNSLKLIFTALCAFSLAACSSVFSGGTGGLVVDAESTSTPKSGIANVDVYAYMSLSDRDSDFSTWSEGSVFAPQSDYYAHTVTSSDGSFTISKLVWEESKPDFGKDADYTQVYLLFYHENYGLTKGESVIISDSVSDTVYTELTAVRKSTVLNLTFEDVATQSATSNAVYVKVSVPQTTSTNTSAAAKVYDSTITGSGAIAVSYPRWQSAEDREAGKESEPTLTISYSQSADEITWLGCYNADNTAADFSFRADQAGLTSITKVVKNPSYSITLYGKSTKLALPSIGGQYSSSGASGVSADDGLRVALLGKDSAGSYSANCGETSTAAQTLGTSGSEKHGVFAGLGSGNFWSDTEYTGRYASLDVKVVVYDASGSSAAEKELTVRSDVSSYNVQLQ